MSIQSHLCANDFVFYLAVSVKRDQLTDSTIAKILANNLHLIGKDSQKDSEIIATRKATCSAEFARIEEQFLKVIGSSDWASRKALPKWAKKLHLNTSN